MGGSDGAGGIGFGFLGGVVADAEQFTVEQPEDVATEGIGIAVVIGFGFWCAVLFLERVSFVQLLTFHIFRWARRGIGVVAEGVGYTSLYIYRNVRRANFPSWRHFFEDIFVIGAEGANSGLAGLIRCG